MISFIYIKGNYESPQFVASSCYLAIVVIKVLNNL